MRRALGALAAVLAFMGCGSGKEKEYLREANAICADANERLDKLPRASSLDQVAKVAKREIAIRREVLAELGGLVPPLEISGGANEVFADQEAREARAHSLEKAAKKKDTKELRKVREEGKKEFPLEAGRARAASLGDCAEL